MKNNKEYIKKLKQEFEEIAKKIQKETDSYVISFFCGENDITISSGLETIIAAELVIGAISRANLLPVNESIELEKICESLLEKKQWKIIKNILKN